jgi:hypothetical protein
VISTYLVHPSAALPLLQPLSHKVISSSRRWLFCWKASPHPTTHPIRSWHFLTPGTQGFPAALEMSDSVQKLSVFPGECQPLEGSNSLCKVAGGGGGRWGQAPRPFLPQTAEDQRSPGSPLSMDPKGADLGVHRGKQAQYAPPSDKQP